MLAKLASIISFRKGVKIYEKIKRNHLVVVGFTTWGKLQWQRISAPTVPKGHQDERCQRALGFRCVCSNRDNQGKTCLSRLQKHPTFQLWYRHVGRSRCVFFQFPHSGLLQIPRCSPKKMWRRWVFVFCLKGRETVARFPANNKPILQVRATKF